VYLLAVTSCSTTKNLPPGEVLYTGISIHITDDDSIRIDDEVLGKIESALAYPPNNALLGSPSVRTPVPLGLWVYNAYVHGKDPFSRLMMNLFAAKPVLISAVNPAIRAGIVRNILHSNGYFNGEAVYAVIPDKKDSLKAKVGYEITFNEPYIIDSVEWRRMQHRGDTLLRLNEADRLVRKGDLFGTDRLEAERQRIAAVMCNNGYYYFKPEYIVYQADSTLSPHRVSLKAGLKQGVPRSILRPWRIGDISVHLNGYDNEKPTDSLYYKDLLICYEGKLRVRPGVIYDQLKFKRGDLYSLEKQTATQTALNRLDIFRFARTRFVPDDTLRTSDMMNVRISASYDYPLNGVLEVKGTVNDNDYAGPGASLNLTRRNIFGGGEALTASVYGSYEWNTRGASGGGREGALNHYRTGVRGGIVFPRLVLPRIGSRAYDFSASTHLDLDVGVLNRAGYFRTFTVAGSLSYEFVPNPIRRHSFTPFKLVFNKLYKTGTMLNYNPNLYQSLQDQFIPSIAYSYTLDNSSLREERSKTWWQFTVSEAGNIVSGVYAAFGRKFDEEKKIMKIPCAQFLKATSELRYNQYLDRNRRLAMRIGGGVIFSYGNAAVAPYNERFYAGGANSIRAFTIRNIGPGRFVPDPNDPYAYIDQNGDWKLEANIEYRARLVGDLDIAVFLDAGNVWLIRKDGTRPGGTFRWKYFPDDIALGTGIGFRYDMDMLVFRFDIGYALHFPYDTRAVQGITEDGRTAYKGKKKYFNTPGFRNGTGFHIAIGYPF
jgi:outer membrane protein assembly factor BamA